MIELPNSLHFNYQQLAVGVYAAVHKWGGAAYSNCGIIDLGDETLVIDSGNNLLAGEDLRAAAERLTGRAAAKLVITHDHDDHWQGAQAFGLETTRIAQTVVAAELAEYAGEDWNLDQIRGEYEERLVQAETRLFDEKDSRWRLGLERTIIRVNYALQVLPQIQPITMDQSFEDRLDLSGARRRAEMVYLGSAHSTSDSVIYLPNDGIAFIGDLGFFSEQPFMFPSVCDLDRWRKLLGELIESDYRQFVPGHGPVGGVSEIKALLDYFDVIEHLVGAVVARGGSLEDALQISLPEPYASWLMGGMGRFEVNIGYLYQRLKDAD